MLYTIGYTGLKVEKLKQWATDNNALIVDIRLSPRSRAPQWNKGRLSESLGSLYHHLPALGNVNYKGGDIQLKDPATGVKQVQSLMATGKSIILMCVCSDVTTCHRTPASALVASATGETVQHLVTAEINTYGKPTQLSMFGDVPAKQTKPRKPKQSAPTMFSDSDFFEPVKKPPMYGDYTGKLGLYKEDPRIEEQKAADLTKDAQERTTNLAYQEALALIENLPLYKEDTSASLTITNTATSERLLIQRHAPDSIYTINQSGEGQFRTLSAIKALLTEWQERLEICH